MKRQVRAEVTRCRIIDAAVELFGAAGYGDTGLTEILHRAEVTKGAFYYHFDTKEAVASAIIDESFQKVREAADAVIESSSPALENVIRATFVVANEMETDPRVQAGKQLAQSLTQVSDRGPKAFVEWTSVFVGQVRAAVTAGGLRDNLDPDDVGETVWATVLGSHLLSDAVGDDVYARLARSWRVLLGAIVPPESLQYFRDFVARTYQTYAHAPLPAQ
jgi:AcrR family transcriptional regulator